MMPESSHVVLFLAAALLLAVTPGPGLFYVAARSLAGGRAEGVASSLGTGLGGLVHVLAGSLGVSAVVLASADLFPVLKLLGAGYLVWLGLRTIRAARCDGATGLPGGPAAMPMEAAGRPPAPPMGPRRAFREGALVEAMNPKTAAFFLAFIPQFVAPAEGCAALQFLVLSTVSVALNTTADILVALAASRVRDGALARPALMRRLREALGAGMIALGLGLAMAKRPAG